MATTPLQPGAARANPDIAQWLEVEADYRRALRALDHAPSNIPNEDELVEAYRLKLAAFLTTPAPHIGAVLAKLEQAWVRDENADPFPATRELILADLRRLAGENDHA